MAKSRRTQVLINGTKRRFQTVRFPGDLDDAYPGEGIELETLARILKTTPEALKEARRVDDVWWADAPLKEHWQEPEKTKERQMNEQTQQTTEKVLAEGWEEVDKSVGSSGGWIKWKDGEVHSLNVFGKPKHTEKDFGKGEGPKQRVSVDVYVPGEGVKTWEMSPNTWRDLKEERIEAGEKFSCGVFKVKRNGSGSDTRYRLRYERQLTPTELLERDGGSASLDKSKPNPNDIPF